VWRARRLTDCCRYSPLGRGLLSGRFKTYDDLPGYLKTYPRFSPENFPLNLRLADQAAQMAKAKGVSLPQFALGWVRSQSKKPGMPEIIVMPGGTTPERVRENAKLVDLTDAELAELDDILAKFETKGDRYPPGIPTNT
jgi:pyridoxine 4-dehydrogenase